MNLLGTIFRGGSIHIWSSNGCFQRRDGAAGSSHTLTVTLADALLIDFGRRWGRRRRCGQIGIALQRQKHPKKWMQTMAWAKDHLTKETKEPHRRGGVATKRHAAPASALTS